MSTERFTASNLRTTAHKISRSILGDTHPFLEVVQKENPEEIFRWVNTFGGRIKTRFAEQFFTSPHLQIPNGKRVSRFVLDTLEIARSSPLSLPDEKMLQKHVREFQLRLNQEPVGVKIIGGDAIEADQLMYEAHTAPSLINRAKEELRKEMDGVAKISDREDAYGAVAHLVYEGLKMYTGWAAVRPLTYGAQYEVIADIMQDKYLRGNPYGPLKDLYKSGCMPIGIIGDQFFVYVPQLNRNLPRNESQKRELIYAVPPIKGEKPEIFIDRLLQDAKTVKQRAVILGYYLSQLFSLVGIHMIEYDRTNNQDALKEIFQRAGIDRIHFELLQLESIYPLKKALGYCRNSFFGLHEEFRNEMIAQLKQIYNGLTGSGRKNTLVYIDMWRKRRANKFRRKLTRERGPRNVGLEQFESLTHEVQLGKIHPFSFLKESDAFKEQFITAGISLQAAGDISQTIQEYYGVDPGLIASVREELGMAADKKYILTD